MLYSRDTQELLRRSAEKARHLGHSYVGSVHLLMALCTQRGIAGYLLSSFGVREEMTGYMAAII